MALFAHSPFAQSALVSAAGAFPENICDTDAGHKSLYFLGELKQETETNLGMAQTGFLGFHCELSMGLHYILDLLSLLSLQSLMQEPTMFVCILRNCHGNSDPVSLLSLDC